MRIVLVVLALLALPAAGARATELQLTGNLTQGGLVIGKTDPGTQVTLDGHPVPVADDGHFLLGFGRDAKPTATLRLFRATTARERVLTVVSRHYEIQRIDGLPKRQVTPNAQDLKRIKAEAAALAAARDVISHHPAFLSGFAWPVGGRISGIYGSQRILNGEPRRPHLGVDIAAPEGTPVRAPADATVLFVHPGMFFNGKTVVLDHGLGLTSAYIHLSKIVVKVGQHLRKGDPIGRIGHTGRATGPHVHWGVRLGPVELDPALLVNGPPPRL